MRKAGRSIPLPSASLSHLPSGKLLLALHSGEVDGYAGADHSKANHEGHERLKTIAAVPDSVHCVLSPTVSRVLTYLALESCADDRLSEM